MTKELKITYIAIVIMYVCMIACAIVVQHYRLKGMTKIVGITIEMDRGY